MGAILFTNIQYSIPILIINILIVKLKAGEDEVKPTNLSEVRCRNEGMKLCVYNRMRSETTKVYDNKPDERQSEEIIRMKLQHPTINVEITSSNNPNGFPVNKFFYFCINFE